MQIKAMEEQFRTRLLIRKKRGLELTETGQKVFEISEKIFGLVAEVERLLTTNHEDAGSILKIGSTKTLVRYLMGRYIFEFREAYPTVQIQIDEGSSEEMIRSVLEDRNDLAIVGRLKVCRQVESNSVYSGRNYPCYGAQSQILFQTGGFNSGIKR